MTATLAARRPEAITALEALQQRERAGAGEPALSPEQFFALVREDILRELASASFDRGGMEAMIADAGSHDEIAEREVARRMRAWHVNDPQQWSRYETPSTRWHLADLCARIEKAFARHGWLLADVPAVGTLTTGQVSATTQKIADGAPLVLIDNGFFRFAGITSQLGIFASHDVNFRGKFSEAAIQLAADLTATQTVLNTCLYCYSRQTPPNFVNMVESFVDSICLFVIGHEYAHIHAGDLNAHPQQGKRSGDRHKKEYAADKIGFMVAAEETREFDKAGAGVFGPFLYFAGLDMLARADAAYRGQGTPALTDPIYPTPYERTVEMLEWLETTPYKKRLGSQIKAASVMYNTILFVWDIVAPAFREARHELAEFDPAKSGPLVMPEARVHGVVTTLWRHVLNRL